MNIGHYSAALLATGLCCGMAFAELRETAFIVAKQKKGEIKIDGKLSDDSWKTALVYSDYYEDRSFLNRVDVETSCRLLYDEAGIYVGIEHRGMTGEIGPGDIRHVVTVNRNNAIHNDDTCELFFDPACAGISYYRWMINANGKYLATWCMDVSNITLDWDAPSGVEVASAILEDGWSSEFFVPWQVFHGRAAARPGDVWGFAHRRQDHAFKRTLGKALKCANPPKAGWLWPDQFAFLYFSPNGRPSENRMIKLISSRYKGSWALNTRDGFKAMDELGYHPIDLLKDVRRMEEERAAAQKAFKDLFAGKPCKPWPLPNAGKYPLGRPETKNGFDGSWRYNIDPDAYRTPHLQWAQNRAERPKILFLTDFGSFGGVRDMVEYASRFACEPMFMTGLLGFETTYAKSLTLSSSEERVSQFETLLNKNPDVLVVHGFKTATISTNYLYEIFRRVRDEGMGILVLGKQGKEKNPFEGAIAKMEPKGDGVYGFGKGTVKFLDCPIDKWSLEWKSAYESRLAAIDEAVESVRKGSSAKRLAIMPREKDVEVSVDGVDCDRVEIRVRNVWNDVVRSKEFQIGDGGASSILTMAGLPGGGYWIDAIARKDSHAVSVASVSMPYAGEIGRVLIGAELKPEIVVAEGSAADIPISWERHAAGTVRVVCELWDRPYGNLRRRMEGTAESNETAFLCRFGSEPFQTLSGDMDVKVYGDGRLLGHGRRIVYFPNRRHEIYPMISWGGADSAKLPELFASQLVERMGYRNGLDWGRGCIDSSFNARSVPYSTRVMLNNTDGRGCEWKRTIPCGPDPKLKGDASPYNPVARKLIGQAFRRTVAKAAPYRPLTWSFGDECTFGYDLGIGAETDKTAFPVFLKEKYGTLDAFNRAHGTSIGGFEEVVHKFVTKALAEGDLASWLDNVQYSEQMYADMFRFLGELVHEADPGALVGAEGSPAGDMERIVAACSFWGPYRNLVENELLRNLAPNHLRTIWLGGYVGTSARDGYPEHQWEFLLTGVVNGDAWFSTRPGSSESCFSGDFSMAPYAEEYLPHLDSLRRGVAPLLVKTPIRKEKFAAYYSHVSRHLASVRDDLKSPLAALERYILFSYRNGFDCGLVTPGTLEKLDGLKVLFLFNAYALSDAEIAAFKAFASHGGVIAANREPGLWDGFLAKRDDPPLKGLWREFDPAILGSAKKENEVLAFLGSNGIEKTVQVEGLPDNPHVPHADPKNPPFKTSDLTQLHPKVIRVREHVYASDKKMRIVGFKTYPRFVGKNIKVSFGDDGYIYEVDRGLVAQGASVSRKLDVPFKLYSFFTEEQKPPVFMLSRTSVMPGDSVRVDTSKLRNGGVYRMETRSPDGKSMPGREDVFCNDASAPREIQVQFPYSDSSGIYSIALRDIATGLETVVAVTVGSTTAEIENGTRMYGFNYDASKIGGYSLEDPLVFVDGRLVGNAQEWKLRRKEILEMFQHEMYGRIPGRIDPIVDDVDKGVAMGGYANLRQYRMYFKEDRTGPCINWMLLTPRQVKGKCPVVMFLNYGGNHELLFDPAIHVPTCWMAPWPAMRRKGDHATEATRGLYADPSLRTVFPVGMILARGFAVATACYFEISPDTYGRRLDGKYRDDDVLSLFPYDPARSDNTTALGAWAWGLMRGMDMLEREELVDASSVCVCGCSRLAKAALIAGAFDERFFAVVPTQTGGGVIPLLKRDYGENVASLVRVFPHWFCEAFRKYAGHENKMPFDSHLLMACVAPRKLLVEGFCDPFYDTEGEFLAVKAASAVWEFLGAKGMPDVSFPDVYDTSAIGEKLGYVRRTERHGISAIDWTWTMDFCASAKRL